MTEVISVRFRGGTKNYYFDPKGLTITPDQYVVVETAQGMEYVRCVEGNHEVNDQSLVHPLRSVVRIATDADHKTAEYNRKREKDAFAICEKKIAAHKLEMKLVNVECSFEGNKIIFFFTAEGRVDFRELVKDLAGVFRARIELRQIGVRDEAKMLGGLGICGRPLCCSQFLDDFIPVSIKMAKTQNLSLNPTKISGTCGRLMCCLKYEQNAYEDAVKRMPKNDSFVDTPDGIGNVSNVDLLREEVSVRLDTAPESPKKYKNCEICVLRNGKGSRDGIEIPAQRPARCTPQEEDAPALASAAPGRRPAFSAAPARESGDGDERSANRRRQRGSRGRNAEKPTAEKQDKPIRERPAAEKPTREKPAADKQPKEERAAAPAVKAERPARGEKPQNHRGDRNRPRRGGEKPTKPAAERTEAPDKVEKVEKLTVRPIGNTTAAMKAAADRAQQGGEAKQADAGKAPNHKNRRRPRYRPKGKGGNSGSAE